MKVTPIKTPIVRVKDDLFKILENSLPETLPEQAVLVVTGKIIALTDNDVVTIEQGTRQEKEAVVKQQAEYYTDPHSSEYNLMLTIKNQILAVNAGIDESNADGTYVLLPQNPYQSAQDIWQWLKVRYSLKEIGVLIIDSKSIPLKWGTIGTALAHCGFKALNDRIGEKDLFGHEMAMTKENIAEGLAVAANVVMGEVAECQPLALIENLPMVQWQEQPPTKEELDDLDIKLEDDAYAPILKKAEWHKGGFGT